VGLWAGLDAVEKRKSLTLPGLELQPISRPACRQSLYRLRYPVSSGLSFGRVAYSRSDVPTEMYSSKVFKT
jgi:hypothetical protein